MTEHVGTLAPFVTVVLPVRNEGPFIRRSLGAVFTQDYPADRFEIIVADGLSTDGTRGLLRDLQAQQLNLRVIDNPGRIVPTGLNAAITQARGEIIVRVDGHTIIAPDYVRCSVEVLQRTGADGAGGRMDPESEGVVAGSVALATTSRFGVGGARFHYATEEETADTMYLGAWPRALFERVGLFDEELVRDQDDEFSYRIRARGGKIVLSPSIRSLYYSRSTYRSLWRQYFQYGMWKVRVMQKHPAQIRLRHLIPSAFVATLLFLALAAPLVRGAGLALTAVAALYGAANLVATLSRAGRGKAASVACLPLTFAVLHLAYGCGVLAGLVRFRSRWQDRGPRTSGRLAPGAAMAGSRPR